MIIEQALWSASNVLVVLIASIGLEGSELSFLLGSMSAIALASGIVRAAVFEGRQIDDAPTRPSSLVVLVAGAAMCIAIATLGSGRVTAIPVVLASIVGGVAMIVEVRRLSAHVRSDSRSALRGSAIWLLPPVVLALSLSTGWVTLTASLLLFVWGTGAVMAGVIYGRAYLVAYRREDRLLQVESVAEYLLTGGIEQLALYLGGFTVAASQLAQLRTCMSLAAPVNIVFGARRTNLFAGGHAPGKVVSEGAWLPFVILASAAAVAGAEYGFATSVVLTMPAAIVARLIVGRLNISSIKDRARRGVAATAGYRSVPSIVSLTLFVLGYASTTSLFLAMSLSALVSQTVLRNGDRRRAESSIA